MAGPQPINSPYGNRPGALPNPVPTEGMQTEVAQDQMQAAAQVEQASAPAGAPQPTPMTADEAFNSLMTADDAFAALTGGAGDEEGPAVNGELAQEPGGSFSAEPEPTGLASLKEQYNETKARLINSFSVTPDEAVPALKETGIFEDVRHYKGDLQVKRKGRGGWEDLDRAKVELIGDTLDFARDAMEMTIEGGLEIGATIGGLMGGPVTGIAANMAGGAAAAVTAKNAGDVVAQKFLDIKQDPKRSMVIENATAAAFGAGFGWLGSKLARNQAARSLLAEERKSVQGVVKQAQEAIEDVQAVADSGIKLTPEGDFVLSPNVATGGTDPEIRNSAKALSDSDAFRAFEEQQGKVLQDAYSGLAERVGNFGGRKANIGEDFVLTAKHVRQAEGKLIGSFRSQVRADMKGKKLPTQNIAKEVGETFEALGGKIEVIPVTPKKQTPADKLMGRAPEAAPKNKIRIQVPTVQNILRENPSMTKEQASAYRTELTQLATKLKRSKGKMLIADQEILVKQLSERIENAMKSANGGAYATKLIKLRNAVKEDWIKSIADSLPEEATETYLKSVARYREIMGSVESLGKVLETEDISKDVLVKKLFESGKSFEFMQSAKTLIQETQPELWGDLVSSYFQRMNRNAMEETVEAGADGTKRTITNFNWKKINNNWRNLDPRVQEELQNTIGVKPGGVDALINLGRRYQNADVNYLAKQPTSNIIAQMIKGVISFSMGGGAAKGTAVVPYIENMGKDQALMRWLQRDGNVEQFVKELKGYKDPGFIEGFLNAVHEWTPRTVRQGAPGATDALLRNQIEDEK